MTAPSFTREARVAALQEWAEPMGIDISRVPLSEGALVATPAADRGFSVRWQHILHDADGNRIVDDQTWCLMVEDRSASTQVPPPGWSRSTFGEFPWDAFHWLEGTYSTHNVSAFRGASGLRKRKAKESTSRRDEPCSE